MDKLYFLASIVIGVITGCGLGFDTILQGVFVIGISTLFWMLVLPYNKRRA